MGKFVTTFEGLADAIVTECLIFPPANLDGGEKINEFSNRNKQSYIFQKIDRNYIGQFYDIFCY